MRIHWLQAQPQVKRVFHPALPDHSGHALWQRDFASASKLGAAGIEPAVSPGHCSFDDKSQQDECE
ncbi:PLP-dependent transferase [Pseudomonas sp. 10C3]|uniref:PLP-dependent transferase n=1 Tax=Pseudomonas sp. 10C3 TaxID=3118753 RepID=UPI002E80C45C|nr:PLP-dependent transferase [Pseudomonas sp. 10C3]MEE3509582.1 PLP-dependent transferase [Pseudomonas sp. 10C3]